MKFPQLPIGQSFTWQGERYCKSSPIAATHSDSGQTRMIPRSAVVGPVGEVAAMAPAAGDRQIPLALAEAALTAHHRRCREAVESLSALPVGVLEALDDALREGLAALRGE